MGDVENGRGRAYLGRNIWEILVSFPQFCCKCKLLLKKKKRKRKSLINYTNGFPGGSVVKNPPASAGDAGSISWSGRFPGEGNGNPLQYSCLKNPMDRGEALQATVHGIAKETDRTYMTE